MNADTIEKDIAKLQQLLGVDREFTEYNWHHIVCHYYASSQAIVEFKLYLPDATRLYQQTPVIESSLTVWYRRGKAVKYCLENLPDTTLFTDPIKNQGLITWTEEL